MFVYVPVIRAKQYELWDSYGCITQHQQVRSIGSSYGSFYFNGDICEILVFHRSTDASNGADGGALRTAGRDCVMYAGYSRRDDH